MKGCLASKFVGIMCSQTEECALEKMIYTLDPEACRETLHNYEADPNGSGIEGCVQKEDILHILRERANG